MSDKLSDKMPELPDAACFAGQAAPESYAEDLYTADQLHAYARQYAQQWREDAARYRWLRGRNFSFAHDGEGRGITTSRWGYWPYDSDEGHGAACDAAIDAARAAREGVK